MHLTFTPAQVYGGWALLLLALATCIGFAGFGAADPSRRRDLVSFASLLAGLACVGACLVCGCESLARAIVGDGYFAYERSGWFAATGAAALTPFVALFLHRAALGRASRVQGWAAHPGWIGAVLFGLLSSLFVPGPWSWVVFAPAVLVPCLIGEALFATPRVPEAANVVVEAVRVAPPSMRPSQAQLSLGQVELRLAKCPVCRDDVRDGARACKECKTPHHAECFDFNGRCAIFGCASFAAEPIVKLG